MKKTILLTIITTSILSANNIFGFILPNYIKVDKSIPIKENGFIPTKIKDCKYELIKESTSCKEDSIKIPKHISGLDKRLFKINFNNRLNLTYKDMETNNCYKWEEKKECKQKIQEDYQIYIKTYKNIGYHNNIKYVKYSKKPLCFIKIKDFL